MLSKLKAKTLLTMAAVALGITISASWTSAAATSAATPAPQFALITTATPVQVIDRSGGISIRIDPPELSAVFPVLP